VFLDANNDGTFTGAVDRMVQVMYDPRQNSSNIVVAVFDGERQQISQSSGDWGESITGGDNIAPAHLAGANHLGQVGANGNSANHLIKSSSENTQRLIYLLSRHHQWRNPADDVIECAAA
jgi:hypothetical protein